MHRISRVVVYLTFLMLIFGIPPVSGKALEDRKWIEVQTENFRIRSLLDEQRTVELAHHLELFRVAASIITNISSTAAPIPTEIFVMERERDFKKLGLDKTWAGVFMGGLRANRILIRYVEGMSETATILHEYVHFLMRNHGSLRYPKWYDEGFAEYLSVTRVDDGFFEIGLPADHRGGSLTYTRWIPMRDILSAKDYDKWGEEKQAMFYAEAWGLVHFLQNQPDRVKNMARYIELSESGTGAVEAFESAFGITADRLNLDVKAYLKKGRFPMLKVQAEKILPDFQPEVTTLSRQQVSLALAQISYQRGKLDKAQHWFKIAVSDESTRPRAEAGLGEVLNSRGEFEAAEAHFERAVALAPDDPYCQIDVAHYWHGRADSTDEPDDRAQYLERARNHYLKAWKLDDSMPEIYTMYGHTFILEGEDYTTAVEMLEEARYLLPSSLHIRLNLARAYAGANRTDDAIEAARSVLAWSHSESDLARAARGVLEQLNSEAE